MTVGTIICVAGTTNIRLNWILAEELLQVDAGLVQTARGEKLKGAGEVVLVGHGEINPGNGRGDLCYSRIPAWI